MHLLMAKSLNTSDANGNYVSTFVLELVLLQDIF